MLTQPATASIASPKGRPLTFDVRVDTNDAALVHGILGEDEYGLAGLPAITGWILDIGAHIGIVTLALAVDNPGARVVAVEAIPDNADLLARNVERNGLTDRVAVISAGAGAPGEATVPVTYGWDHVDGQPDGYVRDGRFIGNIFAANASTITEDRPGISLSDILERFGIDRVALLKIDCEGCEYAFLRDPAVDRIDQIIGEWHGGPYGVSYTERSQMGEVHRLLDATHVVERYGEQALFRAVHR